MKHQPSHKGHILHLRSATERESLVKALQANFFIPLTVTAASTGEDWLRRSDIVKRHILYSQEVTQGMLGCAHSHIDLLYRSLKEGGIEELYVFEDDCQLTAAPDAIKAWVNRMRDTGAPWDILLLGANEYVESEAGTLHWGEDEAIRVQRVGRFWGTHAMVIRPRAAQAALKVFAEAQREGTFLPADWMWNEAIRKGELLAFGPLQPTEFCQQAPGLTSAITGTVRIGKI
jgi:GR25 family glycosyltransferase involved in LPS biosynthesis